MPLVRNRKSRRAAAENGKTRHTRAAALTGVALTATALTAAIAPPAAPTSTHKLEVALAAAETAAPSPNFGIGPLGDLLVNVANWTGNNPFTYTLLAPLAINWNFLGGAPTTQSIYQKLVNDLPYTPVEGLPYGTACSTATQTSCRIAFMTATGIGSLGTTDAIRALIESAQGNTRAGFEPLKTATGTGLTQTSGIYVNNMLRPDGGLASRFPDLMKAFGLDPAMPPTGLIGPNKDGSSVFNWSTSVTWPYNPLADFPITANPFALANSLIASIPSITGVSAVLNSEDPFFIASTTGMATNSTSDEIVAAFPPYTQCVTGACTGWNNAIPGLAGPLIGLPGLGRPDFTVQDIMLFASFRGDLPLTYPMKATSWLINPLLKAVGSPYLLGTPTADILTPPLRILVNIGYDDVLTPDKLDTIDEATFSGSTFREEKYAAYDRTYYQLKPYTPTPFAWFNNPALSPEEMDKVPGDVWTAFTDALKAQAEKPGFGILVPNPDVPPTPAPGAVSAAAQAVPAELAAPAPAPEAPSVQDEPTVADIVVTDDATADSAAPVRSGGNAATAAAGDSGGQADHSSPRGHRGGRGSD